MSPRIGVGGENHQFSGIEPGSYFVELAVGNVTVPDFYSFHTVRDGGSGPERLRGWSLVRKI